MAGFAKVVFEGEFSGQKDVNVLHFRSAQWLPGQGNPFDDTLAFIDAVITKLRTSFLACHTQEYKLNVVSAVGYDDSYGIVTPSPLVRTVDAFGTIASTQTNGAANCAILSLRCGPQVQINGIGVSKRNRGYLALGPIADNSIDSFSHLDGTIFTAVGNLGALLDDSIIMVAPAVTLTPIRVHEKYTGIGPLKVLLFRTYSDVLGYRVNRVASFRRSRIPEA